MKTDSFMTRLKRRFNPDIQQDTGPRTVAPMPPPAPIIAIAVDLSEEANATSEALREMASRTLAVVPAARLACINVLKLSYLATRDTTLDDEGHNKHVNRLVALKHWAQPLKLREGRITYHVLEAIDPAAAILNYAEQNRVDQILAGRAARLAEALAARQRVREDRQRGRLHRDHRASTPPRRSAGRRPGAAAPPSMTGLRLPASAAIRRAEAIEDIQCPHTSMDRGSRPRPEARRSSL